MNQRQQLQLQQTQDHVKSLLSTEGSGHDYWHIVRVVNNAEHILKSENADHFNVLMAAWLHDIGDYKLHDGIDRSKELITHWLESLEMDASLITMIVEMVQSISYSEGVDQNTLSLEAKIVQDADRLDAIGAIGIARAFAFGGSKGRLMHDPNQSPVEHQSQEAYKKNTSPSINHFYEKLLLLKDLMNTAAAKKIALQRHEYMLEYLDQFYGEWQGQR